jgi:hypothetical protein
MRRTTPLVLLLALAAFAPVTAQTSIERAFVALRGTHIGALTPMMTPAMISRRLNSAQLGLRYAFRDETGIKTQAVAGSGIFAIGMASSLAITAGVTDADCVGCDPGLLLGVGADMRVFESGSSSGGGALSVAVSGDVGYARLQPTDVSATAIGIGAPVTVTLGGMATGPRFAAFLTPVFGIGSTSWGCELTLGECRESDTRMVLGGGIGVWNPTSSISASLGFNHVFLTDAKPVFGVNVQIGGR